MEKKSDYRRVGLVGQGQFGKVYGGINRYTGELVALKELNADQISTRQFLSEVNILLTLQHPHIVSCLGVEYQNEKRYLISEYCDSGTLRTFIDKKFNLSIEQKLKLIIDILNGLDYIHNNDIIHRDLKPDNILLSLTDQGWTAKISDFGIAKMNDQESDYNSFNIGYTGSPAYMAPEQFYGKCSCASDIYAIGIICWELFTNVRPFLGTPIEIMKGHLNKTLDMPEEIPVSMRNIIAKALAKLPQNRFVQAQQMRWAILEATLSLSSQNKQLYVQIPQQKLKYKLIDKREIENNICFLKMSHYYIYQCSKNSLTVDHYYIEPKTITINQKHYGTYQLDSLCLIVDLQCSKRGCIIATRNLSKYSHYSLFHFQQSLVKILEWYTKHFVYAYSQNLQWFAGSRVINFDEGFALTNLSSSTIVKRFVGDFIPEQVISIDNRHGVVIYKQGDLNPRHTYFRFFNRRGDWYDTYVIPTQVNKVINHHDRKNTFLTREKNTNNLLLINFYPYSLRRLPLNFRADFYLATKGGFICASEEGHVAFLDLSGKYLGEIHLESHLIAIASIKIKQFIVILKREDKQFRAFYQVDLPESDLSVD